MQIHTSTSASFCFCVAFSPFVQLGMVGSSSTARRLGQQTDGTKVGLPSKCGFRKAVGSPNGDCWVSHGLGVGGWINESMAIPGTDLLMFLAITPNGT